MDKALFRYSLKTMGCKANIYDSLVIERELEELGGARAGAQDCPDVFIMNSCTVTAEADKQALREVSLHRKDSPRSFTVMTGCLAQVAETSLKKDKNIDAIVTNEHKSTLGAVVAKRLGLPIPEEVPSEGLFWGQLPTSADKTRAFLKIQEGCNDFCTYCIIPYARGKSRSVRLGKLLTEIQRLVAAGIQEVVLTGTNIADYGKDFEMSFDDLVEAILMKTNLPRLRLSSLDPTEITPRLLEMLKTQTRLMPHLHVSLQSAGSRVLRAMKRHYKDSDVITTLNNIYDTNPDIFVGMDMIAGFPSETLQEHNDAIALLKDLPWARLHVFPYSPREGTPALKIPGLQDMSERKRRAKELLELSSVRHEKFMARYLNSTVADVLLERPHQSGFDTLIVGHMPNYCRVIVKLDHTINAENLRNTSRRVKIQGMVPKPAQDWTLEGTLENH